MDPLSLVDYEISMSFPLIALLASKGCVGRNLTPNSNHLSLSLGNLQLCEEHIYFALQVASLQNE